MRMVPTRFTSSTFLKFSTSHSPPWRISVPAQLTSASMRGQRVDERGDGASSVTSSLVASIIGSGAKAAISSSPMPAGDDPPACGGKRPGNAFADAARPAGDDGEALSRRLWRCGLGHPGSSRLPIRLGRETMPPDGGWPRPPPRLRGLSAAPASGGGGKARSRAKRALESSMSPARPVGGIFRHISPTSSRRSTPRATLSG